MIIRFLTSLIFLSLLFGCIQTENSSNLDHKIYNLANASPEFTNARRVFLNYCANCHVYHTMTESELQAATGDLVISGSPESSKLYYRIMFSGGGNGPKDMPLGSGISAGDVNDIAVWINSL